MPVLCLPAYQTFGRPKWCLIWRKNWDLWKNVSLKLSLPVTSNCTVQLCSAQYYYECAKQKYNRDLKLELLTRWWSDTHIPYIYSIILLQSLLICVCVHPVQYEKLVSRVTHFNRHYFVLYDICCVATLLCALFFLFLFCLFYFWSFSAHQIRYSSIWCHQSHGNARLIAKPVWSLYYNT